LALPVQIKDDFRAYQNYPEYYADYANLICRANRYSGARGKKGREYYEALKQSGYSTDPKYADNVMRFYRQLGCK
jgi:flagellum-specific peptidoglycan hydrolase FlgJ